MGNTESVGTITSSIAELLIERDTSPLRFEQFCVQLLSDAHEIDYVPTSRSWDLGRDGRATTPGVERGAAFICCSLANDFAPKIESDLSGLLATASSITCCSSRRISELAVEAIKSSAHTQRGNIAIDVLGVEQLASLACRYPTALSTWYRGELADLKDLLGTVDDGLEHTQLSGMRIALTTQLTDDAQTLAADLVQNLLLSILATSEPLSEVMIAQVATTSLHLPRQIQPHYFARGIADLESRAMIQRVDDKLAITDAGRNDLLGRFSKGSEVVLAGRQLIRDELKNLLGFELTDPEFDTVWRRLKDHLAITFYEHGLAISDAIASVLAGQSSVDHHSNLATCLANIVDDVRSALTKSDRGNDIAQAVQDLFHETASPTFAWLGRLCTTYVAICSLGLIPEAQNQILARLREIDLLFDTDVVLSFLSPGERLHKPVTSLIRWWRSIGAKLLVPRAVLEEVAYHAWISPTDYHATWRLLPHMSDTDAQHLLENVFVRGFRVAAEGTYNPRAWGRYISEFRGDAEFDHRKIGEILADENVYPLLDEDNSVPSIAETVEKALRSLRGYDDLHGWEAEKVAFKAHNDGRIIAQLVALRSRKEATRSGTAILVSSSTVLRTTCRDRLPELQAPEAVVPIGAIAYLLSLCPGVKIAVGAFASLLFDPEFATRMSSLERTALRVLRSSKQYRLGYSRRGTLKREMIHSITRLASERGQAVAEVQNELLTTDESAPLLAEVVAEAVDKLAASEIERERDALKAELHRRGK